MLLTLVRTKAPFLILIIVVSGTAPQLAISTSLTGAGVIRLTQEHKGKLARLSLRIATGHCSVWPNKETTRVSTEDLVAAHPICLCIAVPVTHHDWDRIHT